jgi:hypothetical protein
LGVQFETNPTEKEKEKEKEKNLPESLILHLVEESTTDVKFCSCK